MTDQEIILRCKNGDREAFNLLMEKYQRQVFNVVYGMLSDYEDASDATQEVFIKVYRSIASFKGQSSFMTWLYRICSNVCNDFLRKRQRQGRTVSLDADNDEETNNVMEVVSNEPTPDETLEMNESQKALWAAIKALKKEYREIIVYSDIQQLSYDEIAKIIKCPNGTVKSRLNRARSALKKNLLKNRELF